MYESMGRNLKRHRAEELKEGARWTKWQALQARSLRKYRKNLSKIIDKTFDEVIPEAEKQIKEAFHSAAGAWDRETIKAYQETGKKIPWEKLPVYEPEPAKTKMIEFDPGFSGQRERLSLTIAAPDDDSFFRINEDRLKLVIEDVKVDLKTARYAAAKRAGAQYEEILKKADLYYQTGTYTRDQAIEMAAEEIASKGLNCIEYMLKDGGTRRVNVASYVDMALRTSAHRAALTAEGAKRDEWGEWLVISPALHSTCEICIKWQGEILVDDVFAAGKPDGEHELLSVAVEDGFLHPNCRHPLLTYMEGITQIPTSSPYDKTKKNYEAEQKQRRLELMIRKYKRMVAIAQTKEGREKATQQLKLWQRRLSKHLDENPQLRRNYQREKLLGLTPFEKNPIKPTKETDFTDHGLKQLIRRNISWEDVSNALSYPLDIRPVKYDDMNRPSIRVIGRLAEVAFNPKTGKIVSVNKTHSKKVRKYERRKTEDEN